MQAYEPRLQAFLRILEDEEKKLEPKHHSNGAGLDGINSTEVYLSNRMRKSWEDMTWMIGFAARNSWAFDAIFWD